MMFWFWGYSQKQRQCCPCLQGAGILGRRERRWINRRAGWLQRVLSAGRTVNWWDRECLWGAAVAREVPGGFSGQVMFVPHPGLLQETFLVEELEGWPFEQEKQHAQRLLTVMNMAHLRNGKILAWLEHSDKGGNEVRTGPATWAGRLCSSFSEKPLETFKRSSYVI